MNTGDLQYVAGDLYVAGKITSPFAPVVPPADYVTSVVSQAPVSAATSGSVVTMSYAGQLPSDDVLKPVLYSSVPVNSVFGADNGSEGALKLALSGNIGVSGGPIEPAFAPNCLPIGRIIAQTVLGAPYPNQPAFTDGTLQLTNCGIGDVIFGSGAGSVTFTGIGTGAGEGFPPGPGQVVFLEGDGIEMVATKDLGIDVGGGGQVVVSNTGVLSVSAPDAPALQQAKRARSASGLAAVTATPQTGALSLVGGTNMTVEHTGPGEFTFSASGAQIAGVSSLTGDTGSAVFGEVAILSTNDALSINTSDNTVSITNTGVKTVQTTGGTSGLAIQTQNDGGATIVTLANSGVISIGSGLGITAGPKINGVSLVSNTGVVTIGSGPGISASAVDGGVSTVSNTGVLALGVAGIQTGYTGDVALAGSGGLSVFGTAAVPGTSPATLTVTVVPQSIGGSKWAQPVPSQVASPQVTMENLLGTFQNYIDLTGQQLQGYMQFSETAVAVFYPGLTASSVMLINEVNGSVGTVITGYGLSSNGPKTDGGQPAGKALYFLLSQPAGTPVTTKLSYKIFV